MSYVSRMLSALDTFNSLSISNWLSSLQIVAGNSSTFGASVRNRDHCLREVESAILFDDPGTCSERKVELFCSNQSTKFLTRVITFLNFEVCLLITDTNASLY